jgi:DNA-binding HxlR family transcriptional regulator
MANGHEACRAVDKGMTRVFALLGKRWTGLILAVLMGRTRTHFAELRRAIPGISERMLSDRLMELGSAGLVMREVEEGPPLRVCYRLTDTGTALGPAMNALADWAAEHMSDAPSCEELPGS